jgi:chemotaxis signal transduction protein
VSAFEPTELHDGGATYVYLAAVRDPREPGRITGGIAIIFNAARELATMLQDILGGHVGCAAFVAAGGRVLAATDTALATALAAALQADSAVLDNGGTYYACARVRARGYREFKTSDGYDNQVHALVTLRLGTAEHQRVDPGELDLAAMPAGGRGAALEAALFQVGTAHYALPVSAVIEAVSPQGLVATPGLTDGAVGMLEVPTGRSGQTAVVRVLCARALFGVEPSMPRAGNGVVLVLRSPRQPGQPALGLRVDDVLAVLEVSPRHLHQAPKGMAAFAPWVKALIDCEAGTPGQGPGSGEHVLVQLLALEQLAPELAVAAPPVDMAQAPGADLPGGAGLGETVRV